MSHHIIGHLGLAAAFTEKSKRNLQARACNLAAGDIYTYPTSGAAVDAAQPLTIKWATDCPMTPQINIQLYSPANNGLVARWKEADYAKGELAIDLKPQWWNATSTASLYFVIGSTSDDPWDPSSPSGPQFTVNYDASVTTTVNGQATTSAKGPTVTNGGDAVMETVATNKESGGISKGAIAAAVIVPILVIALLAGVAVRFWRAREAEKRRRWSAAVSTHSNLEWEKGARPGEKPASILGRPSTHYSFRPGSMATSSVYAVENNMAGAGAGQNFPRPSFQLRSHSAENVNSPSVRQSRISFAETTRPDRSSRFSLGDNLRPTIGKLPGGSKSASELVTPNKRSIHVNDFAIADDDEEVNISPSQMQSPNAFTEANIRRAGEGQRTGRRSFMSLGGGDKRRMSTVSAVSADDFKSAASARGSVDELRDMEAVMLMRRSMMSQKGSPAVQAQEEIEALEPVVPLPSAPAPAAGSSTVAYGPDQMLAVYAARGKVSASPIPPMPTQTQSGMRQMFNNAPAPGDMRSYVHLNTGTVSSAAVEALPHPGPSATLTVPTGKTSRLSGASDASNYSDDAENVGEAK